MRIVETIDYTISQHWCCALEYGDFSGMNDSEESAVDSFAAMIDDYCASIGAHDALFSYGEESFFGRDEISGLMADCVTLTVDYVSPEGI
jgi:hypothetical protein